MKKVIFVLFVGLLFNSNVFSKSFEEKINVDISVDNELLLTPPNDCLNYAYYSAVDEEECFGDMGVNEFYDAMSWYYDICNEAGGGALTPVFPGC